MTIPKKKVLRWIMLLVLFIILALGFVGYKMWTKPHRNVQESKSIIIEASKLAALFENNETEANKLYLDKVLQINGKVNDVIKNQNNKTVVTIKGTDMSNILCTLEENESNELLPETFIQLKGICTGYLTDVVMVRCKVQKK